MNKNEANDKKTKKEKSERRGKRIERIKQIYEQLKKTRGCLVVKSLYIYWLGLPSGEEITRKKSPRSPKHSLPKAKSYVTQRGSECQTLL
jgi:hypothetical protein